MIRLTPEQNNKSSLNKIFEHLNSLEEMKLSDKDFLDEIIEVILRKD